MSSGGTRYARGDRVRHPTQAAWRLGEVLEDSYGTSVRVFFEGAGEKALGLAYVQPIKVSGAEAGSTLLDNLYLCKHAAGVWFKSLAESIQFFLKEFPGGFHGERLYKNERKYKEVAHALANSRWLFDELTKQELQPRDMIDVQSFIWCIAPGKYD